MALVFAALALGVPGSAAAQQGGHDLRLGLGAVLDFAGEVDTDWGPGIDPDDDLKLTPGLRAHMDYDVHRYVSVGGMLRLSFWEGDDYFEDRNMLFDILLRVAGHYDWRDFRFYLALGIGPTISRLNDDFGLDNPAAGVAASITPGAEWWFSRRAGLFLEMFGWSGHYFSHEVENTDSDVDISLNQVTWQLGVVIGL